LQQELDVEKFRYLRLIDSKFRLAIEAFSYEFWASLKIFAELRLAIAKFRYCSFSWQVGSLTRASLDCVSFWHKVLGLGTTDALSDEVSQWAVTVLNRFILAGVVFEKVARILAKK
jgi:hypothetical protein